MPAVKFERSILLVKSNQAFADTEHTGVGIGRIMLLWRSSIIPMKRIYILNQAVLIPHSPHDVGAEDPARGVGIGRIIFLRCVFDDMGMITLELVPQRHLLKLLKAEEETAPR